MERTTVVQDQQFDLNIWQRHLKIIYSLAKGDDTLLLREEERIVTLG